MVQIALTMLMLFFPFIEISDDFTVIHDGKTIASVHRSEFIADVIGKEMIDIDKYDQFLQQIDQQTYQAPVNAKLDKYGNIVSEQVGYKLNRQKFKHFFYRYYYGRGHSEIEVPQQPLPPRVDSELLAEIRMKRIGQYVTYFNSRNKQRSHNISLASEAINNQVVFPGEVFSFNKIVGKRTKERGYLPAPVIVRGELSEGIGGGICQVSSTLYNAVDYAGLEIVQRYSHSRRVPYVPRGRDATVSWYGPDFVFRNKLNQPILIQSKIYGGQMIVLIHSSEAIESSQRNIPSAPNKLPIEIKIE
ncbi:VanW family protein [Bacillus solitudinis]|uniref:VanW family protein n=1 Tax=Bacillus solitudinis TaxID=2014074 RepID=UPI000C23CD0B|nr:VanW family protein [Bacillus solitudinis]